MTLDHMTSEEITVAVAAGQLDDYLRTPNHERAEQMRATSGADQGARSDRARGLHLGSLLIQGKTPEEIKAMVLRGALDDYLSRP